MVNLATFDIKTNGIPNNPLIPDIPTILPIPNKVRKNNTDSKLLRVETDNATTGQYLSKFANEHSLSF